MSGTASTLRILEPAPGLYAYYDGRVAGRRLHGAEPNWLDDGAFVLGTASYALVDGGEALVYDTNMTLDHARAVRTHLESLGVVFIRVVLSHWHKDHVAGNAVFADCEIVALRLTAESLATHRDPIETGDPPIAPLVMPSRLFDGRLVLTVGAQAVELHHFDIHSHDGAVLWWPDRGILLAGDTLEDPITYVVEAQRLRSHLDELDRLRGWPIARILPNHGDPDRIASGGYAPSLIDANRRYIERLLSQAGQAEGGAATLRTFVTEDLVAGTITYFEPYETVHRNNIAAVRAAMMTAHTAAPGTA